MIIEFLASLPDIQTAISIGGDGARVRLDIPETDLAQAIKLVLMKGKCFKVCIEEVGTSYKSELTTEDIIK